MDFRSLTVKELFDDPRTAAVVKEMAPQLLKYPVKMFNKKSCGEIFDRVVKVGIGRQGRHRAAGPGQKDRGQGQRAHQVSEKTELRQGLRPAEAC